MEYDRWILKLMTDNLQIHETWQLDLQIPDTWQMDRHIHGIR